MATANTNIWAANGIQYLHWAALSGPYPYGATGLIANGSQAGMARYKAVQELTINDPQSAVVYVPGDNGVKTSFTQQPQELPSGDLKLGFFDQTAAAKMNGLKVATLGQWDRTVFGPQCYSFTDVCFIANSPANAEEDSNVDEGMWQVAILNKVTMQAAMIAAMSSNTPASWTNKANVKRSSKTLWGESYTGATVGTTAGAGEVFGSPYPVTMHTLVGNASAATITLNETLAGVTADYIRVFKNGVELVITTDWTVSGQVITLAVAPAAAAVVTVIYQFVPTC
jgi:hypothetical protein